MTTKSKVITLLLTVVLGGIVLYIGSMSTSYASSIRELYQIYMDGNKIGTITSEDELYALINEEQYEIKDKYNVDQVYPPKGFSIVKRLTYTTDISSASEVYDSIKESSDFTLKGYVITVSSDEEDSKVLFRIKVLDKSVFEDAIKKVITSFISEEKYDAYVSGTQEITDVGEIIENMYFEENISIKETYISASDKIYLDSDSLSKFLLFGDQSKEKTYTIKQGDTISSIAEANELNVSEFMVANPRFTSSDTMLTIGDSVIVSLIDPQLTLVYDVYDVEDVEQKYSTTTTYDYSKDSSYKVVSVEGVNGITRVASRTQVINGDRSQAVVIDQTNTYVIREKVDEVITRGVSSSHGYYVETGQDYAWPTNYPYYISSSFGTRYLFDRSFHTGTDITGTGYGSPIYAIADGEVVWAGSGGPSGSDAGINIIIKHSNGLYSCYNHLSGYYVEIGQTVKRSQKIGAMGHSGLATGTHLHLGISVGLPYSSGAYFVNAMLLYK